MSSWTDEDEDGDTHASSPILVSFVGRRRCSWGWHQAWMPSSHFPGLGHDMNPIPYPPLMNFPPPPIVAPIPLGVPPPPYSMPPPPTVTHLTSVPSAMQAVVPQAQANVVNIPVPTAQPTGGPVAPPQAPTVLAGGAPDPTPPPTPWVCTGFHDRS